MTTTIFSINPSYGYITFSFYLFISVFLGTAIYLLMRRPNLLRPEMRALIEGPCSRRCALISCLSVALPFLVYGYIESWQHYFSLEVSSDKLIVNYLFPKRTYEISDIDQVRVSTETEVRRGAQYRIKLKDNKGREFTSQLMYRAQVESNLAALNTEINKYKNLTGGAT